MMMAMRKVALISRWSNERCRRATGSGDCHELMAFLMARNDRRRLFIAKDWIEIVSGSGCDAFSRPNRPGDPFSP